jgi:hypothetical protein
MDEDAGLVDRAEPAVVDADDLVDTDDADAAAYAIAADGDAGGAAGDIQRTDAS